MNLSHGPNLALSDGRGGCGMAEDVVEQRMKIEPLIETVGEGAEVLAGYVFTGYRCQSAEISALAAIIAT